MYLPAILNKSDVLIKAVVTFFTLFIHSNCFANSTTWIDNFDNLNAWQGGEHFVQNGILSLDSSYEALVSNEPLLGDSGSTLKFKIKPAEGTPGYANFKMHLFTDNQGNIGPDTYTLALTGSENKYFKLSRAGYETIYYSGSNAGLLTGPGNWHEITLKFEMDELHLLKNGQLVTSIKLPTISTDNANHYVALDAPSGRWDLDWIQTEPPIDSIVWHDNFDNLDGWNGGPQTTNNGELLLSSNSEKLVTKLSILNNLPATVRFLVKPTENTQSYHNLYVRVFSDQEGNIDKDTYSLTLTAGANKYYKISHGSKGVFYSGNNQGLLSGPEHWHEITLEFDIQRLRILRDGTEVNVLTLPDLTTSVDSKYLALYAKSGDWLFDWLETDVVTGEPVDTDGDGVIDNLDAFPNDPNYQFDSDNDGLPDKYETQHGLQVHHNDALEDADNDGYTNLQEFLNGTDPNVPNSPDLTVPSDLQTTSVTPFTIGLSWSSTDENVTGFNVYRDGQNIGTSESTNFVDTNLQPQTQYTYQIASYDGQGFTSELSESLVATTSYEGNGNDDIANILPNNPAAPQIEAIADQRLDLDGSRTYRFTPQITQNDENVFWRKAYGPDDLQVDAKTGTVEWTIPDNTATESFHIGVSASNQYGSNIETWVLTLGKGKVLYMGPHETYTNLTAALAQMSSGDTLIVRNGVYFGELNKMGDFGNRKRVGPPAGNLTAFTTVIAEDPGKVIFDSQGIENHTPFHLVGKSVHPDWGHVSSPDSYDERKYIALKGMVTKDAYAAGIRLDNVEHVKLVDMGVADAGRTSNRMSANVYVSRSQYVVAEGLYLWGRGRYKLQFYRSSEAIARRIVARIDEYHGDEPLGGLVAYCSKNVRFQNNIVLDGNAREFWTNTKNLINIYGVPATNCADYPENIVFERSIGLNTHLGLMGTWADAQINEKPVIWRDMIGWDLQPAKYHHGSGSHIPVLSAPGPSLSENITIGHIDFYSNAAFFYSRNRSSYVKNSLLHNLGYRDGQLMNQGGLLRNTRSDQILGLDFNNLFGFIGPLDEDSAGETYSRNEYSLDPMLETFLKLPENSALNNKGENGSRLGAEVTHFKGKSGTFYGEPGYDDATETAMWPFPQESLIQRHMRNYRFTGQTVNDDSTLGEVKTLFGARGFTGCDETPEQLTARLASYGCNKDKLALDGKSPVSLTSYIWEYLGTPCPPQICNQAALPPNAHEKGPYFIEQYQKLENVADLTTNGDLSGITYNSELDSFITIHNGDKLMNLFDGNLQFVRQMNNGRNGNDHEDVLFTGVRNGLHEYAIVDEYGRMFLGTIAPDADLRYSDFQRITYAPLPAVKNNGGEGVAYDRKRDRFYVCVEGQVSPSPMIIYQFDRPETTDDISYENGALIVTSPFDAETLRPVIKDISSCYYNAKNDSLLLLSDVSEKIIEVSLTGEVLGTLDIDENFNNNPHGSQFEGMAFNEDFTRLILVSEADQYVVYHIP